jgi:hypothetical protein
MVSSYFVAAVGLLAVGLRCLLQCLLLSAALCPAKQTWLSCLQREPAAAAAASMRCIRQASKAM